MSAKILEIEKASFEKAVIDKFLGVGYENRGRSEKGIDCWGLGLRVYAMAGCDNFDLPDLEYDPNWSKTGGNHLAENYWREWEKIEKPEFLDAVLLKNDQGIAHHGGIVLSGGRFIHASMYGVIISRLEDPAIKEKIEGFYRLRKLYE
jgi:cell wall-associated NlpC family hydrolase